ncbi:hypothetical protein [Imhoffiella purpurea]|uniref:Glycosyltransferase RgtA/B/C/D-like domain-containing protein n=1 Tax=Imhoffiella purpurea TaxID=1249627 RepID=W9V974_9GAMM|nr:hypothetical protein [Imhoffiella purpurea]EXJ15994.1 hypothetical protein D779_0742 [Imhoffiella purpurea]
MKVDALERLDVSALVARNWGWLLLFVVAAVFFGRDVDRSQVEFVTDGDRYQVYFFDPSTGYREYNSKTFKVERDLQGVSRLVLAATDRFRLDLDTVPQRLKINDVRLVRGRPFQRTESVLGCSGISVLLEHHVSRIGDCDWVSNGEDPYVEIALNGGAGSAIEGDTDHGAAINFLFLAGLGSLLFLVVKTRAAMSDERAGDRMALMFSLLVYCIASYVGIALLPTTLAPDELLHIESAKWYVDHFLPPSATSDLYRSPYWGTNYVLGFPDLSYLLIAKAATVIEVLFPVDWSSSLRYAQLLIVMLLALFVAAITDRRVVTSLVLLFLCVPQIVFVSHYFNGDLLNLFMALVVISVAWSESLRVRSRILLVLVIGLQLKTHYLAICLPYALLGLYSSLCLSEGERISTVMKRYPLTILSGVLLGGWRNIANWMDYLYSGVSFRDAQLQHADPAYVAILSAPPRIEVLFDSDWYLSSFLSLYGVLGGMNYFLDYGFYFFGLGFFVFCALYLVPGWGARFLSFGFILLNVTASLYYSVTTDYQAQGRYLFPSLLIFLFLAARTANPILYPLFFVGVFVSAVAWVGFYSAIT